MGDSKPPIKVRWTRIDPNPPPGEKKPQGYEGRKPKEGQKPKECGKTRWTVYGQQGGEIPDRER